MPAGRPPGGTALRGPVTRAWTMGAEPALPAPVCRLHCRRSRSRRGTSSGADPATPGKRGARPQSEPVVVAAVVAAVVAGPGQVVCWRRGRGRGFIGPLLPVRQVPPPVGVVLLGGVGRRSVQPLRWWGRIVGEGACRERFERHDLLVAVRELSLI